MELGKVPPHDIEAEQAVIGSMLTDKDAVMAAVEKLKPDSFYREDNKAVYEAMVNLYNRSEPVDLVTVNDELTSMGMFEKVGGMDYLVMLPAKVPTTANVDKYIKIVERISNIDINSFIEYLKQYNIKVVNKAIAGNKVNDLLDRFEKDFCVVKTLK